MHLVARHHQSSGHASIGGVAAGGSTSWVRPIPDPSDSAYGVIPTLTLGRSEADWNVPWDDQISRRHVRVESLGGGRIRVQKLAGATNPVFYSGNARENFTISIGESFVIGQTRFDCIEAPTMQADPEMLRTIAGGDWVDDEHDIDFDIDPDGAEFDDSEHVDVQSINFGNDPPASSKIEDREVAILSRQLDSLHRLPKLLKASSSLDEAISRVIEMVRPLIGGLDQIAVASVPVGGDENSAPEIVSGDGLSEGPRGDAILQSLAPELLQRVARDGQSVLRRGSGDSGRPRWIAGVPIGTFGHGRWVWWIAGRGGDAVGPRRAMRYLSVVSQMAHQWYRDRAATRRQNTMARFFSPTVLSSMVNHERQFDGDVDDAETLRDLLRPRSAELTVLFFDLRGFTDWTNSRAAAGDLSGLMQRLHESMSIVTHQILASGGVVGDFHGDAVMGFWGWPMEPETPQTNSDSAVGTALKISRALVDASIDDGVGGPLVGGMGIATGVAFAGAIGSDDQLKVTAIGPAVNLAARLQTETRALSESVVIDSVTHANLSVQRRQSIATSPLKPLEIRGWNQPVPAFSVRSIADGPSRQ